MKLLQVVHQFPPRHIGGTELYVESLSRALRKRGHQVILFFGGEGYAEQASDGLRLCSVKGGLDSSGSGVRTFFNVFGNKDIERAFSALVEREAPEVVHFHHLAGLPANLVEIARSTGIPTVFTLHDYWFLCPNSQLVMPGGKICDGAILGLSCGACAAERLGRPYLADLLAFATPLFVLRGRKVWRALKSCDAVIAPSLFLRDMFLRHRFPAEKMLHIPLGIDAPPSTSVRTSSSAAPLRFAYIGSLAWQKGVHLLVQAFNEIDPKRAQLWVYGDENAFPEYSQALRRATRSEGIHFMGKLSREQLWAALSEADVLAVPSLWYENFPLVVQEAFAARVPVIASRIGALAELVRDGVDGLLFQPGNVPDLLSKIGTLIENPSRVEELRGNIPSVETMSHHAMALEELYRWLKEGGKVAEFGA